MLNKSIAHTELDYFKAYSNYFWRWEDHGEVLVSTHTNTTIGYREDILKILESISHTVTPRFGSVLLIIYACTHHFKALDYDAIKHIIHQAKDDDSVSKEILEYHVVKAFKLLKTISALPSALKQGEKRVLLLTEILKNNSLSIPQYKSILEGFNSGQFDETLFKNEQRISYAELISDVHVLSKAEGQFSTTELLQEKLETGVVGLKKAALDVEEDILDQLAKDKETALLGDLTKQFIGGLKIPVALDIASDLSLGGVSDVSNKGDFDKLLLSELAYSEDVFLSRLINNEALYFKRETAQDNTPKDRIILLDATIKAWGTPRILGLALALAFKYHPKSNSNTTLYLLDGENYSTNTLENTSQIKEVLKFLSPFLECSSSLKIALQSIDIKKGDEVIFIVEASHFKEERLQNVFNLNKQDINYLITVNRKGTVNYFSIVNESLKKTGHTVIDVEAIVNKKRTFVTRKLKHTTPDTLPFVPAFFSRAPQYPILHTATEYVKEKNLIYLPKGGAIVKNRFNELVYFPDYNSVKKSGYIIEKNIGNYHFKFTLNTTKTEVYLLTYTIKKMAGFSIINLKDFAVNYIDLKPLILQEFKKVSVTVYEGVFYINTALKKYIFDEKALKLVEVDAIRATVSKGKEDRIIYNIARVETPYVKIDKVRLTSDYSLVLNAKRLDLVDWGHRSLHFIQEYRGASRDESRKYTYVVTENITVLKKAYVFNNPKLKFRYVRFKEGSEILFDNKGFAHLKSSDINIPEFTIKIQLNTSSSFYISNNSICATPNLINDNMNLNSISAEEVHENYLQPFIENIVNAYL